MPGGEPVSFARGGLCFSFRGAVLVQRGLALLGVVRGRGGWRWPPVCYTNLVAGDAVPACCCATHTRALDGLTGKDFGAREAGVQGGRCKVEGARNNSRLASRGHPSMTLAVAAVSLLRLRRPAPLGVKGRAGQARTGQARPGQSGKEGGRAVAACFLSALWTKMIERACCLTRLPCPILSYPVQAGLRDPTLQSTRHLRRMLLTGSFGHLPRDFST